MKGRLVAHAAMVEVWLTLETQVNVSPGRVWGMREVPWGYGVGVYVPHPMQ